MNLYCCRFSICTYDFVFICTIDHKTLYPSLYCSSISVLCVLYWLIADFFLRFLKKKKFLWLFCFGVIKMQWFKCTFVSSQFAFPQECCRMGSHTHTDTHYNIHTQRYCTTELRRQHITVFVFKQTHLMNDPTFVFLQSLTSFNVSSLTSPHGNVVWLT